MYPFVEAVAVGVLAGDFERVWGEVKGEDVGERKMVGEGNGDGSRACAYVGESQVRAAREALQDGLDEKLGLRAGDEGGEGDEEGQTVELLFAEDVLDGLEGEAAADEGVD